MDTQKTQPSLNATRRWYDKKRFVLPLLIFFPFGFIPLWLGKSFSTPIKGIITGVIVLFYAFSWYQTSADAGENVKVEQQAIQLLKEGKIDEAKQLIETITSKRPVPALNELKNDIDNAESPAYIKMVLAEMTNEEFENLKQNKYRGRFAYEGLNNHFMANLQANADRRAEFILEYQAEQEALRKEQGAKALAEAQALRADKLKIMFSPYDGSHRGLEKFIKSNMHDPDSFEHVETRSSDEGSYILVYMKYRGKNAFGGLVLNEMTAKSDLDGNIIEVVAQ